MAKVSHDSETAAHGQQVISVCGFIHHDFGGVVKTFLPKRAKTKKFLPNVFEMPGGHVELWEDIIVGLKREVHEEFGKDISVGDPFAVFTYKNRIKGSHTIEVVYFAKFLDGVEGMTLNPEDHSGYEWLSREEVVNHKSEIISPEFDLPETGGDPEYNAILRGFELLGGGSYNFG